MSHGDMFHTDSPLHIVRKLALTMFSGQLPAYTGRYQGETTAVNQLVIASFINTFSAPAIRKTQEVKNAKSSKPNTLSLKTNKPNIHMHVHTPPHTYHITHPHISHHTPTHITSHTHTYHITHPHISHHTPTHITSHTHTYHITHLHISHHTPTHITSHTHTYHITHPHISYGLLGAWEDFLNQTVLYRGCSQDPSSIPHPVSLILQ